MGRTCQALHEGAARERASPEGETSSKQDKRVSFQECATHFEIRIRRRPTASANSGTDAVVDDVRELRLRGPEQGPAGT
jgi:hypothetical protein